MITDADRRKLHSALAETIGSEPSGLLMELLPPTGWAHLATQQDIDIAKTELRIEIHEFRAELKTDIHDLRTELKADIHNLRTELKADIQGVRDEVKDLGARVDSLLPKLISANIVSMIGLVGLMLAALSLA